MNDSLPSRRLLWTLAAFFLLVWLYALGARTLVPTDEGRYAEMAREMAVTGDWITPRLNGIKYFFKPPLQNWMNALTFSFFGFGEWQARLWTGLNGLFGIVLIGFTARKLYDARVAVASMMVLASSFFWAALSHVNTLDMGLAGMMTLALCSLLLAQRDEATRRERRNWMLLCWAGMALAVMSKGLIGLVLPGAVLVTYSLLQRDLVIWTRLHFVGGLLVFSAITVPWFVLVSLQNPEFPQFFFIREHLQRFTSKVHNRPGPWYYFVPIMVLGIVPWLASLLGGLWNGWRTSEATRFQPARMLVIWSVLIFVFFSVSGSKLPSYVIPIFPALALLIGLHLSRVGSRAVVIAAGLMALLFAAGLPFVARISGLAGNAFEKPLYADYEQWVLAAAVVGLIGSALAFWLARRKPMRGLLTLGTAGFVAGQILMLGHEPLGRYAAGIDHVPALRAELRPDVPLFALGRHELAIPFYLGRTLTMVEHTDELAFGLAQEPHLWIPKREDFVRLWIAGHASNRKAVAVLSNPIYESLKAQGVPMRVIGRDPRRVIVTNQFLAAGAPRS